MSKSSQTKSAYAQTFRTFKIFRAFSLRSKIPISRVSCVQNCLCPDFFCIPNKNLSDNLCVHVQTIVRSKNFMPRLSCVQNCLCPDFRVFQTKFCAIICAFMSRQSRGQKTLCPDFRAFTIAYVQTFVCSKPKCVRSKIYNCYKKLLIFFSSLCILFVVLILRFFLIAASLISKRL